MSYLPIDEIIQGDCVEVLAALPAESVDLIFADPPYNLQLHQELWRPNHTRVEAVDDAWDKFENFEAYDNFSNQWLSACRRVLKPTGTLWVIGTYHNVFRIGKILQDLQYWILNDVIWVKTNPMPNFRGVRFTNAHETLIWAKKTSTSKYTINYHAMKPFNDGKQMRSTWKLPICKGGERIRLNGESLHSTQKPLALLHRVILSSTNPEDVILDPFFGTGTTGAAAKMLHRNWIGIENNHRYIPIAKNRIDGIQAEHYNPDVFDIKDEKRLAARVPFSRLVEAGYIKPGQTLFFNRDPETSALVRPNGILVLADFNGSIHQTTKYLLGGKPANGWLYWYVQNGSNDYLCIDDIREEYRQDQSQSAALE